MRTCEGFPSTIACDTSISGATLSAVSRAFSMIGRHSRSSSSYTGCGGIMPSANIAAGIV